MDGFRYLSNVTSLELNETLCTGCGECTSVCPHSVFAIEDRKARVIDLDVCMECGACANNCAFGAIEVNPGVGCAGYIIQSWLKGPENAACGGDGCC